jgi:selenocysteine-specific elongation factor
MAIVATAGHIDHGKTSLIHAVTGTNPDRLPEEKKRGMTLDLGFAFCDDPHGTALQFVDVPGHEDLVRTMIAGCWSATVLLLVIDVSEGLMPQSVEHLSIAQLLQVPELVVALTKCDKKNVNIHELEDKVVTLLQTTQWLHAPLIRTSARTGEGIDALIKNLSIALNSSRKTCMPTPPLHATPRLFVDRVFVRSGVGTVVTGTLTDGVLAEGTRLTVARTGRNLRVREIQHRGMKVESLQPWSRCAINFAGAGSDDLRRGDVVVVENQWWISDLLETEIEVLPSSRLPLKTRGSHTFHVGTASLQCRIIPKGTPQIRISSRGRAEIKLLTRIALRPGDRFIIRDTGQRRIIGGGAVTVIDPPLPEWCSVGEHARRTHEVSRDSLDSIWISEAERRRIRHRLATLLEDRSRLEIASLSEPERFLLPTIEGVLIRNDLATLADQRDHAADALSEFVRARGLRGPNSDSLDRSTARMLANSGVLIERSGITFHIDVLRSLLPVIQDLLVSHPEGFEISHLRQRLEITRKHAVPLAEALDALGITCRVGSRRQAGAELLGSH